MSFWALTVPGKSKPSKYEVEQTGELAQYVHVTNVALPHDAPPGPHSLTITQGEHEYTIATLNKATHPQHNLDFILDQTIVFKNTGPGPLHLLGYQTVANVMDLHGDEDDSEFDEDEEDEDEEDEDEEAPNLVPVANGKPLSKGLLSLLKGKPGLKSPAKVEEDDDADADDVDDEDDEDEDDEEDEADTRGPIKGIPMRLGEDDIVMEFDSDVEDEGEDDEGEDEDEDEDEEDVPLQVPTKRPHPAIAATPAAKKSKGLEGVALAQAPKSAPPKSGQPKIKPDVPAGDKKPQAKPADAQEYEAAIVALLKSKPNKTVPLASLGTAVHRPEGVPKLGTFIKTKDKLFKLDKLGQNVTLIS